MNASSLVKSRVLILLANAALLFLCATSTTAQSPTYPASQPQVIETPDSLSILFPQQVGIVLHRSQGGAVAGFAKLWVGSREILSMPAGYYLPPALEIISPDTITGVSDWAGYLLSRQANGNQWPSIGGREMQQIALDASEYLGYRIDADTVFIRTSVTASGKTGEMQWIFSPVVRTLGPSNYQGLGWKVRLQGLQQAAWLNVAEPVQTRLGDWTLAQTWGKWFESQVGTGQPLQVPDSWYFADTQPFYFAGGAQGTAVSFFSDVVAAQVGINEEAGRHFVMSHIPLGAGTVRETSMKLWLWSDKMLSTKWTAVDEWTAIYDATAEKYRRKLGLGVTEPKPTIFWAWPGDAYYRRYQRGEITTFWLDDFRANELPQVAELGFRVIFLQSPWDSDADHQPETYLPGSDGSGSGNAPWRLEVSAGIGGHEAMRALIERAHELDVRIILWSTPGHLSNSSPLLVQNPDWVKWRLSGIPEDFDYPDITGTNQRGGYYDYASQQYHSTFADLGYDGIWQDSFLTFGVLPDFREMQPRPSLDRSLAMQQEFWQMGMTEVHIEGCGPLGLSTSGYGHEPPVRADLDKIRGREYGLYRYIADLYVEPEAYFRALASKGAIGVASLAELKKLPQTQIDRVTRANHDYLQVMDKMQHRTLLVAGDTWQGVAWHNDETAEVVLFAFESFPFPAAEGTAVTDITTGEVFAANRGLETQPFHTYILGSTIVGVKTGASFSFDLMPNYPNPFNPKTTISYHLPTSGEVVLTVYNLLGQRVRTLVRNKQAAGSYRVNWDGRNEAAVGVSSGIYVYRLQAGDAVLHRRMVLLR